MSSRLERHRHSRQELLKRIVSDLVSDERLVAAWLTGSHARDEADSFSDLDLTLVVAGPHSDVLCRREEQVGPTTTAERLALFRSFGAPALIHENNHNAPRGGTFTFVLYADTLVMVDWTLVPHEKAVRPLPSRLLFEKTAIPLAPLPAPEDPQQSRRQVAEQWAFFWMMTAVTIKHIARGDGVFAAEWIEHLHGLEHEVARRLKGEPWTYRRGSRSRLSATSGKQLQSIRQLCRRMLALRSRVAAFTGSDPVTPASEVVILLSLAEQAISPVADP